MKRVPIFPIICAILGGVTGKALSESGVPFGESLMIMGIGSIVIIALAVVARVVMLRD